MTSSHCVLLAGGLGTRLTEITGGLIPKALVEVGGIPFLHFKLLSLIQMGFTSVDILVGQHGDQIEQFVANGSYPNISIRCFGDGPTLLGTAGSIRAIAGYLPETFWVTYADSYVVADVANAELKIKYVGRSIMTVLKNEDRVETSNVSLSAKNEFVIAYEKNPTKKSHQWIDYGLLRFERLSFEVFPVSKPLDLRSVIESEISANNMCALSTDTMFWDIGNPERLLKTTEEFRRRSWI